MAVHNLSAPNMTVARGWQSIDTFPKDGTVVEITDDTGFVCRAQWHTQRILTSSFNITEPTHWRYLE